MSTEKIGRYQIKSELGRGGMATVFHAYDPSFERNVAIKVLPHAMLHDPQFRTRFEREAKMIALLEHPAIVPVYDFGEQDGQPYIVMRYMAGGSLSERLKPGALSLEDTVRLINRLAPALDAAHARGIIHRDLKPGNVLFDQYGNAFLSDFGIARLSQSEGATLTGGSIVGTPAYMSPEQVQGEKNIDGRSDIYALGVLIYQMLTGFQPYRGETPAKVMMMHVLEPVPDIRTENADLPPSVAPVLERALAKAPDDRFATTKELATALESAQRGSGLTAPRPAADQDRTVIGGRTHLTPPTDATVVAGGDTPLPGSAPPPARARPRRTLPWIALLLIVLLGGGVLLTGGLAVWGMSGGGPLAMLAPASPTLVPTWTPSATPAPTQTLAPTSAALVVDQPTPTQSPAPSLTNTPEPSATQTSTPEPSVPMIGGADMIAYINDGDIWIANLDGTDLQQLTSDGASKTNLRWTPDGEQLTYISGKCVQSIAVPSGRAEIVTCFNFVDSLKAFEISPDSSQVAISLDNQLYIVPYDRQTLSEVSTRTHLREMATCQDFAPFERNLVTGVEWAADNQTVAARLLANLGDGRQGNIIQLFAVDTCIPNPRALDNFPPPRFEMKGADKNPYIEVYAWDGLFLFALHNNVRNDGFGDLYIYNTDLHKVDSEVNPVGGRCCYRDPSWSPDGSHLVFAFQDLGAGADSVTRLYLVPFGSIGTGAQYQALPLPEISDPREKPQPVLRPAR